MGSRGSSKKAIWEAAGRVRNRWRHRRANRRDNVSARDSLRKESYGADESLWDHVYHPKRLVVVQECISVTGTIYHRKKEADGDDHIQLRLDDKYTVLLNTRNKTAQKECLVLEPVCQHAVTQPDAKAACQDFHSGVKVPKKGSHVKATGA